MKKADLDLRAQALAGDEQARRALGLKYLRGSAGLRCNYKVAITHLLPSDDPGLLEEIAVVVPLETLIETGQREVLEQRAACGSRTASKKLGTWLILLGMPDGWQWLEAGYAGTSSSPEALLAATLSAPEMMSAHAVIELLLENALNTPALRSALNVLRLIAPRAPAVRRLVLSALRDAHAGREPLSPLEPHLLALWLLELGQAADPFANYVLGCAQIGLPCGLLDPASVKISRNMRAGYASLLRAAFGGRREAWLALYKACASYRAVLANHDAALFFLERAANADLPVAQALLGARTLKQAKTLEDVLSGQRWLWLAAQAGVHQALELLESFRSAPKAVLVAPALDKLVALDAQVAVRLQAAHHFGLTRKEALGPDLHAKAGAHGLIVSAERIGFAVPAINAQAHEVLGALRREQHPKTALTPAQLVLLDSFGAWSGLDMADCFSANPNRSFSSWRDQQAKALEDLAKLT